MAQKFQDKLKQHKEFIGAFNMDENAIACIALNIPKEWDVLGDVTKKHFNVETVQRDGVTYLLVDTNTDDIELLFDAIDYIASFNRDVEKKKQLLAVKAKELSELFANESYEKLSTIQFVFGGKKRTTKKQKENNDTTDDVENTPQVIAPYQILSNEQVSNEEEPSKEDSTLTIESSCLIPQSFDGSPTGIIMSLPKQLEDIKPSSEGSLMTHLKNKKKKKK